MNKREILISMLDDVGADPFYCNKDMFARAKFSDLLGKTLIKIEGAEKDSKIISFYTSCGKGYHMFHLMSCCEDVAVEDICGRSCHMLNTPILMADESCRESLNRDNGHSTHTWTFYKLATIVGYLDIRWFGESNGYYSEKVDFAVEV